jgi:type VI secretion system protein ImpC
MSDIFISYARADRSWVRFLAAVLEAEGWTVWWDRELIAGDSVDQVIERELNKANCIVVVWSTSSITSRWVRDEAQEGLDREVLLPLIIDDVKPPMGFRGIQAENFIGWQGEQKANAFISLSKSISRHTSKSEQSKPITNNYTEAEQVIDGGKVRINYLTEMNGQAVERNLPLVVGVFGHFSGTLEFRKSELRKRSFKPISLVNRDHVLTNMEPLINFRVKNQLAGQNGFPELDIALSFQLFSDFEPSSIQANLPILSWVSEFYQLLNHLNHYLDSKKRTSVDSIFNKPFSPEHLLVELSDLVQQTAVDYQQARSRPCQALATQLGNPEVLGILNCLIDELKALGEFSFITVDELGNRLRHQLNEILHARKFQQLEASWRGLSTLLTQSANQSDVEIKIFDASKSEILFDLQQGSFDNTVTYRKLKDEQYGPFDAAPFGLLVCDWTIGTGESDLELIQILATIASKTHLPMAMSANQELMDVRNKNNPQDNNSSLWFRFRKSDKSRYITLTAPQILLRNPYEDPRLNLGRYDRKSLFPFFETISDKNDYLWGSAAYVLASCVIQTFGRFGWYATLSHPTYGPKISQTLTFDSEEGRVGPTSIVISEGLEQTLSENGLLPIVNNLQASSVYLNIENTLHLPCKLNNAPLNLDEQTNTKLSSLLTLTRVMQYIDLKLRDSIGSFRKLEETETFLNAWLATYICNGKQNEQANAKRPLVDANVTITPVKGGDHIYEMEVTIVAGYQFNQPENMKLTSRMMGYF